MAKINYPSDKPKEAELKLLSEKELSPIIGISVRTLQQMRTSREGPPFVKIGRLVRYSMAEVMKYLARHTIDHEKISSR